MIFNIFNIYHYLFLVLLKAPCKAAPGLQLILRFFFKGKEQSDHSVAAANQSPSNRDSQHNNVADLPAVFEIGNQMGRTIHQVVEMGESQRCASTMANGHCVCFGGLWAN